MALTPKRVIFSSLANSNNKSSFLYIGNPSKSKIVAPDDRNNVMTALYNDETKGSALGINAWFRQVTKHYLGISRVGLLIKEDYLIAKDLSQMSFDNLLNIHHNLTAQGVLDIFVKLSKHKIIKDQLVVELKKALETLALNWTGKYVPYKDQTNKF